MSRFATLRPLVELTLHVLRSDWAALTDLRARIEPDRRFREALLQLHLFAGFPAVVEAFARLERAGGVGRPDEGEGTPEPDRPDRGRALFARIYGEHAERVEGILERSHPQLGAWVLGHAYGRVLTRPGLEPAERELLAVTALALRGPERQLASHLRGALACGADDEALDALEAMLRAEAPDAAGALGAARAALGRAAP